MGIGFQIGFKDIIDIVLVAILLYQLFRVLRRSGALNVFFRDVGILWNTINPALFYLSPIAYSYQIVPEEYRFIILYNPLYYFLGLVRDVIYEGRAPSDYYLGYCLLITGATVLTSIFVYRKTRNGFISNL